MLVCSRYAVKAVPQVERLAGTASTPGLLMEVPDMHFYTLNLSPQANILRTLTIFAL